jgi:hypothetical protein
MALNNVPVLAAARAGFLRVGQHHARPQRQNARARISAKRRATRGDDCPYEGVRKDAAFKEEHVHLLLAHTRLGHVKENIAQAVRAAVCSLNEQNRNKPLPRIDPALGPKCAAVAVRSFRMAG